MPPHRQRCRSAAPALPAASQTCPAQALPPLLPSKLRKEGHKGGVGRQGSLPVPANPIPPRATTVAHSQDNLSPLYGTRRLDDVYYSHESARRVASAAAMCTMFSRRLWRTMRSGLASGTAGAPARAYRAHMAPHNSRNVGPVARAADVATTAIGHGSHETQLHITCRLMGSGSGRGGRRRRRSVTAGSCQRRRQLCQWLSLAPPLRSELRQPAQLSCVKHAGVPVARGQSDLGRPHTSRHRASTVQVQRRKLGGWRGAIVASL